MLLSPCRGLVFAREGCLGSEQVFDNRKCLLLYADCKWVWLSSRVCLLRLEVNLGSLLESELEQKWRHGALKAYVG